MYERWVEMNANFYVLVLCFYRSEKHTFCWWLFRECWSCGATLNRDVCWRFRWFSKVFYTTQLSHSMKNRRRRADFLGIIRLESFLKCHEKLIPKNGRKLPENQYFVTSSVADMKRVRSKNRTLQHPVFNCRRCPCANCKVWSITLNGLSRYFNAEVACGVQDWNRSQ